MIEIKDFKIHNNIPKTYGYTALGSLHVNLNAFSSLYSGAQCFEATGVCGEKEFTVYSFPIGFSSEFLVLGDLVTMPAYLLDTENLEEDLFKALSQKIESETGITYIGKTDTWKSWEYASLDVSQKYKNYNISSGTNKLINKNPIWQSDSVTSVSPKNT